MNGELTPSDGTEITIKDIARICGVGVSTVSRAINNHPDINPVTKQAIMDTIEKYGYIPNNSARNLKRTDAKCIAILVKGLTNPFFAKMIRIIEKCGDKIAGDFNIILDENGNYAYTVSDTKLRRFKADIYGKADPGDMSYEQETATAEEMMQYFKHQREAEAD